MCRVCLSAASQTWNLWKRYKHNLLTSASVFPLSAIHPLAYT